MKKKVFLGGTCGKSTWRNELIPLLEIDYFNPVVDDWTPECQEREFYERGHCDICLYVITPDIEGYYSIAEVTEDAIKRPGKTVFAVLDDGRFNQKQIKSLNAIGDLILRNGAFVVTTLQSLTYDENLKLISKFINNF